MTTELQILKDQHEKLKRDHDAQSRNLVMALNSVTAHEQMLQISKKATEDFKHAAAMFEQQRDEQAAHCGALIDALRAIQKLPSSRMDEGSQMAWKAATQAPAISLANLKARAILIAVDEVRCKVHIDRPMDIALTEICYVDDLKSVADELVK